MGKLLHLRRPEPSARVHRVVWRRRLRAAARELGATADEIYALWNAPTPHLDGTAGHRYNDVTLRHGGRVCLYCLRPESYSPPKDG